MDLDQHLKNLPRLNIPSDLERILEMPRQTPQDPEEAAQRWTSSLALGDAVLRPSQGVSFDAINLFGSAFIIMGVGHGKTLVSLLAAQVAGCKSAVLFVPPALLDQAKQEMEKWSNEFKFLGPEIVSYGILSTQTDLLDRLSPDLIICDEAHYLRPNSARTRRVKRYLTRRPRCKFIALSGTMTSKSLLDYDHLLLWTLRDRSPIPLNRYELERWAACIDPDGEPTQSDLNRLGYLVQWSGQSKLTPVNKQSIRRAFKERLTSTPGVVSTRSSSCDASLYLKRHNPPHSAQIKSALKNLSEKWETPDGEPIADASTKSRAFKNLCLGFFYRWRWGEAGPDLEWLEARRDLNRRISKVLRYSPREGRDSPALVIGWSSSGGGNIELQRAVALWDKIKDRATVETEPVWICDQKMQYLADYQYDLSEPAIFWYSSQAVGGALQRLGLPVHGAGSLPPKGETCAASIAVHGRGRNLQKLYARSFIVECSSSGSVMEQLLGRIHRAGFDKHECWWDYFDFSGALKRAKSDAEYIQETQGTIQKLNLASFL